MRVIWGAGAIWFAPSVRSVRWFRWLVEFGYATVPHFPSPILPLRSSPNNNNSSSNNNKKKYEQKKTLFAESQREWTYRWWNMATTLANRSCRHLLGRWELVIIRSSRNIPFPPLCVCESPSSSHSRIYPQNEQEKLFCNISSGSVSLDCMLNVKTCKSQFQGVILLFLDVCYVVHVCVCVCVSEWVLPTWLTKSIGDVPQNWWPKNREHYIDLTVYALHLHEII